MVSALDARDRVRDARVLDLFAGSGGLGIEALSRGAAWATFVERDADAVRAVADNLEATSFTPRAEVWRRPVPAALSAHAAGSPRAVPYDLVFVDPPYDLPLDALHDVLAALVERSWLAPGATVVVECARPLEPVPGLRTTWSRRFGDTLVVFLEPEESATPAS